MTEKERQEMKDFIFQAIQAGKSETSNLVVSLERKMDVAIGLAVEKHVNGHIRDIKAHLEDQDEAIKNLKDEIMPLLELKRGAISIKNIILWFTPIGGFIWWLINKLR